MSADGEIRKLSDLRVVDLRTELEKRGLDKGGNKQALVERLHKALEDEGHDPETYNFELDKKAKRLSTSSRETEENATEDQPTEVEKTEPKEEEKAEVVEKNNNSEELDTSEKESTETTEKENLQEEKSTEETNENVTDTNKEETVKDKPDESPITLTVEEEELDSVEADKSTKIPKIPDEKKNITVGDQPRKEAELANKQQDSAKNEENATNGSSNDKEVGKMRIPSDSQNRNLWITNISQTTRATELKQALSEHGKVIGAKVVINARYPGACCYGYVKMETVADADNCIEKLNGTELNGQIIRIEKVRPDHLNPLKNAVKKPEAKDKLPTKLGRKSTERKDNNKTDKPKDKADDDKEKDKDDKKTDKSDASFKSSNEARDKRLENERRSSQKRPHRSRERTRRSSKERQERSLSSRSRRRERELLTFDKIKDERDRERFRERERMIREEKRRREAVERQRKVERRQRTEAARLDREREKLRMERERLERERAEIMQLERERQKIEREKLELEKLELERVKIRMQEEERRTAKRPSSYRRDDFEEKRRPPTDRHYDEAPPPPRFESAPSVKPREPSPKKFGSSSGNKDYKSRVSYEKRDSYPPKRDRDYEAERSHAQSSISRNASNINVFLDRDRGDVRDPRPRDNPPLMSNNKYAAVMQKSSNYGDRERSPHFRSMREERRTIGDHKGDMRPREHRYDSKDNRSFERGNGNSWGHPSITSKVFSNPSNANPKVWAKDSWRAQESSGSGDRWNSTSGSRLGVALSAPPFSNNSSMSLGPTPCPPPCPPPPGINNYVNDRFDYKNIRKY